MSAYEAWFVARGGEQNVLNITAGPNMGPEIGGVLDYTAEAAKAFSNLREAVRQNMSGRYEP